MKDSWHGIVLKPIHLRGHPWVVAQMDAKEKTISLQHSVFQQVAQSYKEV